MQMVFCASSFLWGRKFYLAKAILLNRHGIIVIDYCFLSNRNRLNWTKVKCNRNRFNYQFNRNRRLLSRLNLEIFTLHHCAINRGCGGWVSSFITQPKIDMRKPWYLCSDLCYLPRTIYRANQDLHRYFCWITSLLLLHRYFCWRT